MRINPSVVFRVDASLEIGTGHSMRCLTLAEALRKEGADVSFISRELPGNMIDSIESKGFSVTRLPAPDGPIPEGPPMHAPWAGVEWQRDAEETEDALEARTPDWLVVDHYAFDERWEKAVRREGVKIIVIDDLADRPHGCDLLLDQNLGREATDYQSLVPEECKLLIGPRYALLRVEFAGKRSESLIRRMNGELRHVLVSMGGIDKDNITVRVLKAVQQLEIHTDVRMTVVLGENTPWFEGVNEHAARLRVATTVRRGVDDMAALMSEADLAIGGVGVSTWERCSVGLPTMLFSMATNQASNAHAMTSAGAALHINACDDDLRESLQKNFAHVFKPENLRKLSERSAQLCDGDGTARALAEIIPGEVSFRDAELQDSRRIWEWRRYPGHERFNKNPTEPDFCEHHEWFTNALKDPNRNFRIVQLGRLPCGYLRLDCLPQRSGAISICLSADGKGRKLSRTLLHEADRAALEMGLARIDAEVHAENHASCRAFESAGYTVANHSRPFMLFQRNLEPSI